MSSIDLLKYGTRQDLHTHTTFCDGKNTPEEMVLASIDRGLKRIGFSGHAHTPFDERYCMSVKGSADYRAEIAALKDKYRNRIEVLCGIEQDMYSDTPTTDYDYVIGSVHYLKQPDGNYVAVDENADILKKACCTYYDGDMMALCEHYFETVAQLANIKPSIVGHIDLVAKFNRGGVLFDESDERYLTAAFRAVDALIPTGALFEINTGVIPRGYRDIPYPAPAILEYIRSRGGRFIFSGDVHGAENLCYGFDTWSKYLR